MNRGTVEIADSLESLLTAEGTEQWQIDALVDVLLERVRAHRGEGTSTAEDALRRLGFGDLVDGGES